VFIASIERLFADDRVRLLGGFGVTYARVRDYTGKLVDAVDATGASTKASEAQTRLAADCTARRIVGCSGGRDDYLRFGISYDTRDYEPDPNRGTFIDLALDAGTVALGSQYDYLRLLIAMHHVRRLVGRGVQVGRPAKRDMIAGGIRLGTDYLYSSTHEQGSESFGDRIGGLAPDKGKVGGNAKGLDAVTWLAAEGARFAPVAALGAAGSPESRFFIKPNPANWTGYKFLTASDLMQTWLDDFEKKYDISAATVAQVVSAKGKTTEAQPPAGAHYNLTLDARHDQA